MKEGRVKGSSTIEAAGVLSRARISALLFCLSIASILPFAAFCQSQNWTIEVKGLVEEGDKKLVGAIISVYADNTLVTSQTTPNGGFDFNLNGNMNYMLTFTKPGYITKRISFSTKNVPADRAKAGFSPYSDIEVDIFPEVPGTDIDQILMQPIGKIGYDPSFKKVGDFTFDEQYTESIQSELDKILAAAEKAKQLQAEYKKIIAKADGEFNAKDYSNAKNDYTSASALKPSEQYPKDQLAAIDKLVAAQASAAADAAAKARLQAKYDSLVRIGDNDFKSKNYNDAKSAYNGALQVKPGEQYPKDQLAAIDRAIKANADAAAKARLQAKYDSLVKIGDNAFTAKSYTSAKAAYNGALQVKPNEQYPKDQLAAIDRAIKANADAAAKARLQAKYDSLVKIGDNAFTAKSYTSAKAAYNGALQVKPDEQYPKTQLAAIDKLLADKAAADAEAARKARLQAQYDSLIRMGDNNFKSKSYNNAKAAYNGALQLKPDEQYPKAQLAAIDKLLADKAAAAAEEAHKARMQAQYDSLVKVGDKNFKTRNYTDAKSAYNDALQLKSGEQYPKDQIAAIDKILADKAAAAADAAAKARMQAKYDSLVRLGDNDFKAKNYIDAKTAYSGALQVKPNEQYPKDQLAAIDRAIKADADAAAKARVQAKYDSLVSIGDNDFKAKNYKDAKTAYNGALQVKPDEQYPKDQLAAIDRAIKADADAAAKAMIQAKYDSLVKIGDKAFTAKNYNVAKPAYNAALQVKPDEQYPKDQLAAIDRILAGNAAAAAEAAAKARLQAKYDSLLRIGDGEFRVKSYEMAKKAYEAALQVKPTEQYPKDQLAAIDRAMKADENARLNALKNKALQRKYDSIIKLADNAMQTKTYQPALDLYGKASQLLPSEQYPKDQITAIKNILSPKTNVADTNSSGPDSVAAKYAQGVTEEQVDEPNGCVITKRVVVIGKHGWIYTRKSWSFGVYFFKASPPDYEDEAITEDQWTRETRTSK